jgi:opacity protein-like surface antigen
MKRLIAAVSLAVLAVPAFAAEVSAPFEQTQFDRALPTFQARSVERASAGATAGAENVWANDHNFIAPAQ